MWLVSCACVVYFPSLSSVLILLRGLKRKDGNWNRITLCDESCALTFPGFSGNLITIFLVDVFLALKLESHSEAAAVLHMTSPHRYLAGLHAYMH